jgi:hypothetical protein
MRAVTEAERFSRYLAGAPASTAIAARYADALAAGGPPLRPRDELLLRFALTRPRGLGLLDAGLALTDPDAELRRRLYLMFAILEASPEHHERFLPVDRGPLYPFAVAFAGVRGAVKAILGVVLVRLVTR